MAELDRDADLRAWTEAKRLDAHARGLVLATRPDALDGLQSNRIGTYAERRRLQLAAAEVSPEAITAYREADRLYWSIVERNQGLVKRASVHHAKKSRTDVDAVLPVAQEGAFRGAIAWDPSKGALSTAMWPHIMATWQKAPERQGAVMLGSGSMGAMQGGFGRASVVSLDAPLSDDGDATMLDMLAAPDDDGTARIDAARVVEALAVLDEREREVLTSQSHGQTNEAIGQRLGLSRERVRQIATTAARRVREHMEGEMVAKQTRKPTGRPRDPVSEATMERIHALRAEGAGLRKISQDTGMVRSTVARILKREGREDVAEDVPPPPTRYGIERHADGAITVVEMASGQFTTIEAAQAEMARITLLRRNAARTPTADLEPAPQPAPVTPPPPEPPAPAQPPPPPPRSVQAIAEAIGTATARLSAGEAKLREGERLIAEARAALRALHAEMGAALAGIG